MCGSIGGQCREMFVQLHHAPGHTQADVGEAAVIGGVEQKAHGFVLDLPNGDACYLGTCAAATDEAWGDENRTEPVQLAIRRADFTSC
jgi:hypothetical protein